MARETKSYLNESKDTKETHLNVGVINGLVESVQLTGEPLPTKKKEIKPPKVIHVGRKKADSTTSVGSKPTEGRVKDDIKDNSQLDSKAGSKLVSESQQDKLNVDCDDSESNGKSKEGGTVLGSPKPKPDPTPKESKPTEDDTKDSAKGTTDNTADGVESVSDIKETSEPQVEPQVESIEVVASAEVVPEPLIDAAEVSTSSDPMGTSGTSGTSESASKVAAEAVDVLKSVATSVSATTSDTASKTDAVEVSASDAAVTASDSVVEVSASDSAPDAAPAISADASFANASLSSYNSEDAEVDAGIAALDAEIAALGASLAKEKSLEAEKALDADIEAVVASKADTTTSASGDTSSDNTSTAVASEPADCSSAPLETSAPLEFSAPVEVTEVKAVEPTETVTSVTKEDSTSISCGNSAIDESGVNLSSDEDFHDASDESYDADDGKPLEHAAEIPVKMEPVMVKTESVTPEVQSVSKRKAAFPADDTRIPTRALVWDMKYKLRKRWIGEPWSLN